MTRFLFCFSYLSCLVFSDLPGAVVRYLSLILESSWLFYFKYFFCFINSLSFFSWHFNNTYVMTFKIVPQSLDVVLFFLSLFFTFCISVWEVSFALSLSVLILSSATLCLLESPLKVFLMCVSIFFSFEKKIYSFSGFPYLCFVAHLFLHVAYFSH